MFRETLIKSKAKRLSELKNGAWGGIQVLVDLVIACGLAAVCMIINARKRGVNPWGYVVLTLFLGSIGPLSYLLVREWGRDSASINKLQGHSV